MRHQHREYTWSLGPLFLALSLLVGIPCSVALAQPPITPSGLNTQVTLSATPPPGHVQYDITGGTRPGGGLNLFHSFGDFNVPNNNIANFLNNSGLPTSNILGRVTGGNVSNIFGTIQTTGFGNANLFLMNPAGFLFGPTATVNVGGMVAFTTADYLRLADGVRFNATPKPAADMLLSTAPVAAFGFLGSNPGAITVQGSQLSVAPETGIALVGGNITIQSGTLQDGTVQPARLSARIGQVSLVSVASKGEVVRTTTPQGETLDVQSFSRLGDVTIDGGGVIADLTLIRGGQFVMNNGTIGPDTFHFVPFTAGPRSVDIAARDDALLQGSTINTLHGDTTITAKNLTLKNTRIIAHDSVAEPANQQGTNVSLTASNNLTIDGGSSVSLISEASPVAKADIALSGSRIVMDGFLFTAGAFNTPGLVSLAATKSIDMTGTIRTRVPIPLFQKSGNVTIDAPIVKVTGGMIDAGASPLGRGGAGDVTITGRSVSLTNGTTIDAHGGGNPINPAGRITIRAGKLLVDNSSLNVSTGLNEGPGTITLDGTQSLMIQNGSTLSANSNLFPGSTGFQAGTIHLESGHKIIVQDSTVSANAFGANGGTIELVSPGVVRIEHSELRASTTFAGHGGTIEIATPRKVVIEGSALRTNAVAGPGGTINITASKRVVEDAASFINATSATGPNGTVTITAPKTILNGVVEP